MGEKKFIYNGPNSAVTLRIKAATGEVSGREVIMWKGREVALPDGHEYVSVLQQRGLLTQVAEQATSRSKKASTDSI